MKSTFFLSTVAGSLCWASALAAQVAVEQAPAPLAPPANGVAPAQVAPVPATPVVPTPGGERRAVRREERRIDRNDPNGTLAPAIQGNGTVRAVPNNAIPNNNLGAGAAVAGGATVGGGAAIPASPERWRYSNQNGQWWYYTPSNSWVIWNGNSWDPYTEGGNMVAPAAPTAPANGAYTSNYRGPNRAYSYGNQPYRRGWFGRRYYY